MRVLLLSLLLAATPVVAAQDDRPPVRRAAPRAYVSAATLPGLGLVATVAVPTLGVLTREASVHGSVHPRPLGGSGRIVTAVGVGGSVQVSRALEAVRRQPPGRFAFDVGLRVGPLFTSNPVAPSAASRARAFEVAADPFVRATTRTRGGRLAAVEVGGQTPSLRVGIALGLP